MYRFNKYNQLIEERSYSFLYNIANDKILTLTPALADLLKAHMNDLDALEKRHPTFFAALKDAGMIVAEDADELNDVIDSFKMQNETQKYFRLIVNPTLNCNLSCWYCYENHKGSRTITADVLASLQALIERVTARQELEHFHLDFFGGEPLLSFDKVVVPIIETVKEHCVRKGLKMSLSFTTNGVLLNEEKVKILLEAVAGICTPQFQITLDGDKTQHDRVRFLNGGTGTFDTICANIIRAAELGCSVCVRCNYTNQAVTSFFDIISLFSALPAEVRANLTFDLHKVWQESPDSQTDEEVKTLYRAMSDAGLDTQCPSRIVRHLCYADSDNTVVINHDGRVFNCTAREFAPALCDGRLQSDGTIEYNKQHQRRMTIRYGGTACHRCKIFPICHGGCSQDKLEARDSNDCIRGYSEQEMLDIIYQRVFYLLSKAKEKAHENIP